MMYPESLATHVVPPPACRIQVGRIDTIRPQRDMRDANLSVCGSVVDGHTSPN